LVGAVLLDSREVAAKDREDTNHNVEDARQIDQRDNNYHGHRRP